MNNGWNKLSKSDLEVILPKSSVTPKSQSVFYTEKEVWELVAKAMYDIGYEITLHTYPDGTIQEASGLTKWFDKNKKK